MMRFATITVAVLAMVAGAYADYSTDFATDKSADFTVTQIGGDGSRPPLGANALLDFTGGSLKIGGAWNQRIGLGLITSGENNDGIYGNAETSLTFRLYNGADFSTASNAGIQFGMSVRQFTALAPRDYNTYPLYRVDWDRATQTLVLKEHVGYMRQRVLATSNALSLAGGTSSYQLVMGALTNETTGNVDLYAKLYQDGVLMADLSAFDAPKNTELGQEGGSNTDWADGGVDQHLSGYTAFYGGGINSGTKRGLEITAFSVTSLDNPPVVYHPGDANKDGTVTDADYTLWADNYNATGATWEQGDFNADGAVTDADYTIWADHYGHTSESPVPEPATLSLLGLGLMGLIRRRK